MIHPSAIVNSDARIASDVSIGPFCVIEADVEIGAGCIIREHTVIRSGTRIGANNQIFQFCSIGEECQNIRNDRSQPAYLIIGDNNVIREYCALHAGSSVTDSATTTIGSDNFIMLYSHIGHDCTIGNHNIIAPATNIGGHVEVGNFCTLGGGTLIHQFCSIGSYSITSGGSIVTGNVPAFSLVYQETATVAGINRRGMKRHGISSAAIDDLHRAFKTLYRQGKTRSNAVAEIAQNAKSDEIVMLLQSLESGGHGRTLVQGRK